MFIAVLVTITKIWNQHKCPTVNEKSEENELYVHNGVLSSFKRKEMQAVICDSMDEPREHYAKWNWAHKDK
jgi:hypothetical protein